MRRSSSSLSALPLMAALGALAVSAPADAGEGMRVKINGPKGSAIFDALSDPDCDAQNGLRPPLDSSGVYFSPGQLPRASRMLDGMWHDYTRERARLIALLDAFGLDAEDACDGVWERSTLSGHQGHADRASLAEGNDGFWALHGDIGSCTDVTNVRDLVHEGMRITWELGECSDSTMETYWAPLQRELEQILKREDALKHFLARFSERDWAPIFDVFRRFYQVDDLEYQDVEAVAGALHDLEAALRGGITDVRALPYDMTFYATVDLRFNDSKYIGASELLQQGNFGNLNDLKGHELGDVAAAVDLAADDFGDRWLEDDKVWERMVDSIEKAQHLKPVVERFNKIAGNERLYLPPVGATHGATHRELVFYYNNAERCYYLLTGFSGLPWTGIDPTMDLAPIEAWLDREEVRLSQQEGNVPSDQELKALLVARYGFQPELAHRLAMDLLTLDPTKSQLYTYSAPIGFTDNSRPLSMTHSGPENGTRVRQYLELLKDKPDQLSAFLLFLEEALSGTYLVPGLGVPTNVEALDDDDGYIMVRQRYFNLEAGAMSDKVALDVSWYGLSNFQGNMPPRSLSHQVMGVFLMDALQAWRERFAAIEEDSDDEARLVEWFGASGFAEIRDFFETTMPELFRNFDGQHPEEEFSRDFVLDGLFPGHGYPAENYRYGLGLEPVPQRYIGPDRPPRGGRGPN